MKLNMKLKELQDLSLVELQNIIQIKRNEISILKYSLDSLGVDTNVLSTTDDLLFMYWGSICHEINLTYKENNGKL